MSCYWCVDWLGLDGWLCALFECAVSGIPEEATCMLYFCSFRIIVRSRYLVVFLKLFTDG
jgi:hypothetical protein